MKADIKQFAGQWFVCPRNGLRGGLVVASKAAALAMCAVRGWEPVMDGA